VEITRDLEFEGLLIWRIALREFEERTGIHCSDLVYCVNKSALRKLKPVPTKVEEVLIWSLGWATQRWLTGEKADADSIVVDGISVTPDVLIDSVPWELKATYQSSSKPIVENLHWLRQIMAQCYVSGSLVAYLSRFEIMGNWGWVYGKKEEKALSKHPTLSAYKLAFTQQELENNWNQLVLRRDLYQELLDGAPLLPRVIALMDGADWECSYCNYTEECKEANTYGSGS